MKKKIVTNPKKLTISPTHRNTPPCEYDKDFYKWANQQAKFLKSGEYAKLDMDNLFEELEGLGKSEKFRLGSYLENALMHKLKVQFQPEKHSRSWDLSIKEAIFKAQQTLEENPSLKSKLRKILENAYFSAKIRAAKETEMEESIFPDECPWPLEEFFPRIPKKYVNS